MKSKLKLIIAGAVVLLLLVGAVCALVLTDKPEESEEEEVVTTAAEQSRLLYEKDPTTIKNIHIKNETGEYDIDKYSEDTWVVLEFYGHPLNIDSLNNALDKTTAVTAQKLVDENAPDLSIYGLTEPRAVVTTTFEKSDGSTEVKKMLIGDESPVAGKTYFCFDGETTVYTINTSDILVFLNDKYYYVNKTVYITKLGEAGDTTNYQKVNSINISRKDIDYDIVLEYDVRQDSEDIISGNSSSHIMTSPVRLDLNPDLANDTLKGAFGLTAESVEVMSPTDEQLAEYGIADPFATVDFDIVGGPLHLKIGNEYTDEDGNKTGYYCMAEGIDIIYVFDKSALPWAYIRPLDISMTMITSTYIYAVDSFDVETKDTKAHFELSGDNNDFAVKSEYDKVTADDFKSYYQFFLRAPAEELYLDECTDPADATVTVKSQTGTDVVEFIKSSDRMTIIRLNGVTSFRCRTAYVDRLIENLSHLTAGEELITTW